MRGCDGGRVQWILRMENKETGGDSEWDIYRGLGLDSTQMVVHKSCWIRQSQIECREHQGPIQDILLSAPNEM